MPKRVRHLGQQATANTAGLQENGRQFLFTNGYFGDVISMLLLLLCTVQTSVLLCFGNIFFKL